MRVVFTSLFILSITSACNACSMELPTQGRTYISAVAPTPNTNHIAATLVYTKTVNPVTTQTEHALLDLKAGYLMPGSTQEFSLPGDMGVAPKLQNVSFNATSKTIRLHDLGRDLVLSSINTSLTNNYFLYFNQSSTLVFMVMDTASVQWLVSTPDLVSSNDMNIFRAGFLGSDISSSGQASVRVFPDVGIVKLPAMCCICVSSVFFNFNSTSITQRNSFEYYDSRNSTLVSFSPTSITVASLSNSSATVTRSFTEDHLRSYFVPWSGYSSTDLLPFQSPCTDDSQCVTATNGCCDCANGGIETAVLSSKKAMFLQDKQNKCGWTGCSAMARTPACFHPSTGSVKCIANRCRWTGTYSAAATTTTSVLSFIVFLFHALFL